MKALQSNDDTNKSYTDDTLNKGNTLSCYTYGNKGISNESIAMPTHNTLSNKIANCT